MLNEIFKALLITSFAGSCLAAVIAALKPVTKKVFGYAWHYYIWLAVLIVMILPVRFNMPLKTETVFLMQPQAVESVETNNVSQTHDADNAVFQAQENPKSDILQKGTALIKRVVHDRLTVLAFLWFIGAIVFLLLSLIGYVKLIIKMRKQSDIIDCPKLLEFTNRKITVRVWGNMSSPFMAGIFKPVLVLPEQNLSAEQLYNILRHEMMHFKRHDILYKWFAVIVKCLHWFNPVVWYVWNQITAECEISCDMAVVKEMNSDEEMGYIDTILALLPVGKSKQIPLTTQMASSKNVLRRRFKMIRDKRKTSKFVSAMSAVIAVVIFSTTVFASGVLSDLATDDYTVEITNNGEKIKLINKPFIENGEVYVPLRETLEKSGAMEHKDSNIEWIDGRIMVSIADDIDVSVSDNESGDTKLTMFYLCDMEIGKCEVDLKNFSYTVPYSADDVSSGVYVTVKGYNSGAGQNVTYSSEVLDSEISKATEVVNVVVGDLSEQDMSTVKEMANAPILKESATYIPYSYIASILFNKEKWNIDYSVHDKNGKMIDQSNDVLVWQKEPEIFADPYSDFLTDNIATALGDVGLDSTYSYEYINHVYNDPNDKVDFRYRLKLFDDGNETQILKISFEKNENDWVMYNSEIEK